MIQGVEYFYHQVEQDAKHGHRQVDEQVESRQEQRQACGHLVPPGQPADGPPPVAAGPQEAAQVGACPRVQLKVEGDHQSQEESEDDGHRLDVLIGQKTKQVAQEQVRDGHQQV